MYVQQQSRQSPRNDFFKGRTQAAGTKQNYQLQEQRTPCLVGRQMRRHEEEGRPVHAQVRSDSALVLQNIAHAADHLRQLDHLACRAVLSGCCTADKVWCEFGAGGLGQTPKRVFRVCQVCLVLEKMAACGLWAPMRARRPSATDDHRGAMKRQERRERPDMNNQRREMQNLVSTHYYSTPTQQQQQAPTRTKRSP